MKLSVRNSVLMMLVLLIVGCNEENLPYNLVSEQPPTAQKFTPPCSYNDSGSVDGPSGMNGKIRVDVQAHFDDIDVVCRFSSSAAVLMLNHQSRYGLKDLTKDAVVDYSTPGSKLIYFSFVDWGFTSYPSMKAISGKLYIQPTDVDVKFTWCDIVLRDKDNKYSFKTRGGVTAPK